MLRPANGVSVNALLTLILVPVMYSLFDDLAKKLSAFHS